MNITTLQYFVSAAELQSFTKAAKKHYIAQTAISQQIAKLETKLDVKLFEREKNRVVLTSAGQVFYEDVKSMLSEFDLVLNKVKKIDTEVKHVITIGYTERHEFHLLSRVIRQFSQEYPQVEFLIKEGKHAEVLDEVKHGLCDLAVIIGCASSKELEEELSHYTIYQGEMLLAVSEDHPKANQKDIASKELGDEKFIALNVDNLFRGFHDMYEHSLQDGYEIQVAECVTNIGAQLLKVEMNQGVAFVQDLITFPSDHTIKLLPIINSAHKYSIDVVWNHRNAGKYLRKLIELIQMELPK